MERPGFSLIEVLVAMAVALLLVVGTAEIIALSLAAKRSGDIAAGLVQVVSAKLEQLKSEFFDGSDLEPGGRTENVSDEAGRRVFVLSWEIEDAGGGMKRVRIRAHPRGRPGSVVALTHFLSRALGFVP
jgi:prepilin-type N-terminal cleavage/methylation domain-containing protein